MSITIGDAILWLRARDDKLDGDLKGAEAKLKGWGDQVGSKMVDVGKKLTLGVTVPLVAAGAMAAKMASDYEESLNKVKVVFGQASDEVVDFSNTAARALGMSKEEALSSTGTLGNLFTSMGIGEDKAAGMSIEMTKLASDLASFNNIDPTVALEKLRAGLTGESEPLKTLGVNLNEAMIKQKAFELGLYSGKGALDASAKAQAAYALILEQTQKAQGDFARTSGGMANQTRILNAQLKDAAVALGTNLVPLALKLVTALNSLLTAFNNLSPGVQSTIVALAGVAAAIGPVMSVGGGLIKFGRLTGGLFGAGGVLATVGTTISGAVVPALTGLGAAIAAVGAPVWLLVAAFGALIAVLVVFGKDAWNTIKMLSELATAIRDRLIYELLRLGTTIRTRAVGIGKNIVYGIWDGIKSAWNWLKDAISTNMTSLLDWVKTTLGIASHSKVFAKEVGRWIPPGIGDGFEAAMPDLRAQMQVGLGNLAPALAGAGAGAGVRYSVGRIEYHGAFSRDELARLDRRSGRIAEGTITGLLK